MNTVLSITIPFFAIIFLGTFFRIINLFNNDSAKVITKFALYVSLPPYLFINILKASSNNDIFNWDFIIRFEIITIVLLLSSFLISYYYIKKGNKNAALFSLNSSYPNYGYMGIPLSILAFGEIASIPISLILLIDTFVLLSFVSFFSFQIKNHNFFKEILLFFLNFFKNPILLGVLIGFICVIFDFKINLVLFKFLNILSYSATPTALFAIGINLYNKIENNSLKEVTIITIFKLIIHPLLIFLIFYFFPSDIPTLWIKVAILCTALPVAGNVFAMSIYYDSYIKITSSSILVTSILSTLTVPVILYFLI